MKQPLIIIAGPTGSGKSHLAVRLSKTIGGEVVSADSMQVYRGMDIGSAKIRPEEMEGIPHHLIDVVWPWEEFSVARFKELAKVAIAGIYARGHIPVITGGTGFYIQALLYDIDFTGGKEDTAVRDALYALAAKSGEEAPRVLHTLLMEEDPQAARAIHPNNIKRVIRAIEYHRLTGMRISEHNAQMRRKESPYAFLYYALTRERPLLYARIDARVDEMISSGLVCEVEALKAKGCHRGQTAMQGLGYKEILDYLDGSTTLEEAVNLLKRDTRHFAKRQLTWLKREREVIFLDRDAYDNDDERIVEKIRADWCALMQKARGEET